MSKADQLGAGRFGGGARPLSARRQAVAAATGVPTDGVAPPTALPPHRISLNPDNPRSSLGDLTDLAGSLKTHGQKQAITVMNRDAYVKANPEREADLEHDTTHVVIDGSSRLAAAREAGLTTLNVMVSDDQGNTSEELLESALVANIHRQDLEELDEARALQRLLKIHGSQTALAKRLHRSQGWVSQRLALLNLTPELQARISEEPIDLLRAVGNKPAEEQQTALQALKAERARKEGERKERNRKKPAQESGSGSEDGGKKTEGYYDVIGAADTKAPAASGQSADERPAPQVVPEPRTDKPARDSGSHGTGEGQQVRRVPYDEPGALAMLLDTKIEKDDVFFALLRFLNSKALNRDPARLEELARSFLEQSTARTE
ncbi:ParB/RepB/Spo0J family partition protein [Streptomyces sp. DH41]|uniref:ParB/RepB/Spo0J family partition protein n=1 Tax=Streptomyces sp. DH41 TaxID=3040125 RepID=UPI002440F86F|nr:ParB/RepB/Spo0J family partition protein [Streptomyces sp. DH41]MDG9723602.1 ParB/RepB/Spo0J family partition protein [Streptomyces sp. DH41]